MMTSERSQFQFPSLWMLTHVKEFHTSIVIMDTNSKLEQV